MTRATLHLLCRAWVVGAVALLGVDALLQMAIAIVTLSAGGPSWTGALASSLIGRGTWVVFALALAVVLPRLAGPDDAAVTGATAGHADALRVVGLGMVAVPALWVASGIAVVVVRTTLAGNWPGGVGMFQTSSFYRAAIMEWAPWLLAGAVLVAVGRHAD